MEEKNTVTQTGKRKTCMKHKKKDKKSSKEFSKNIQKSHLNFRGKMKTSKPDKERIQLPKDPTEFSSNWKKLLKQSKELKDERKRAKKRKRHDSKSEDAVPDAKKAKESAAPDIWFDDVDELLLEGVQSVPSTAQEDKGEVIPDARPQTTNDKNPLVKPESFSGPTKVLAMDCEMVGVGDDGEESILARVSLVNQYGQCVYDTFVQATEKVTDYRTAVSGVRKEDMENGEEFFEVQRRVSQLINGKILVGHAIYNDLKVLYLDHPRKMIRDTQRYAPFKALFKGRRPALKKLSEQVLKVPIQSGEHSSVQDAQATMRLYTMYRQQWEKELRQKHGIKRPKATKSKRKRT